MPYRIQRNLTAITTYVQTLETAYDYYFYCKITLDEGQQNYKGLICLVFYARYLNLEKELINNNNEEKFTQSVMYVLSFLAEVLQCVRQVNFFDREISTCCTKNM